MARGMRGSPMEGWRDLIELKYWLMRHVSFPSERFCQDLGGMRRVGWNRTLSEPDMISCRSQARNPDSEPEYGRYSQIQSWSPFLLAYKSRSPPLLSPQCPSFTVPNRPPPPLPPQPLQETTAPDTTNHLHMLARHPPAAAHDDRYPHLRCEVRRTVRRFIHMLKNWLYFVVPDVDLTQSSDIQSRSHFPAPPTGHDLMALFPAAAPECGPEARGGPTSGFFQRQERAFFAQAGKEIVRVRVEVDVPSGGVDGDPKSSKPGSRPWLGPGPHQSPMQTPAAAGQLFPHPNSRQPQRGTVPVTQLLPINCHPPPPPQLPPNLPPSISHQPTPPPQDPSQPAPFPPRPDFPRDEDDDSWKKPMPHNERRRAGKHTKRVIVRWFSPSLVPPPSCHPSNIMTLPSTHPLLVHAVFVLSCFFGNRIVILSPAIDAVVSRCYHSYGHTAMSSACLNLYSIPTLCLWHSNRRWHATTCR